VTGQPGAPGEPGFVFQPERADPARTVYVDGTEPGFRSLSHWPGNTTPAALKHDLSTGIALAWARLSPAERKGVLGDFDQVANNHYDTDGALSAFALLRPDEALPREEALLAVAAAGDFSIWKGEAALAVDLTVMSLTHSPSSPLAGAMAPGQTDRERRALGYAWLIEHLPAVLDDPFAFRAQWTERHAQIVADVARIQAGTGVSVRRWPGDDLALVSSDRPITSVGLNLAAGEASRVLLVLPSAAGFRYRFRYRVESWFELVSRRPPPRADLAPAVLALDRAERGAGKAAGAWWAGDLSDPVSELGFGAGVTTGSPFDDPDLDGQPHSRLLPSAVIEALRPVLATGLAPAG
jgi:hypothetical protein